jgi:WD40-like Beta Propeller Repeat
LPVVRPGPVFYVRGQLFGDGNKRREDVMEEQRRHFVSSSACALFAASAMLVAYADSQFAAWGTPVNLGSPVNTASAEICPSVSKDGLSLYFFSDRPGGFGGNDLYVSRRASVEDSWGEPENLGPAVNTPYDDSAAMLSPDGHELYITSNRPGGFGTLDLYVSRRHNKRDDFAWQPPTNLGVESTRPRMSSPRSISRMMKPGWSSCILRRIGQVAWAPMTSMRARCNQTRHSGRRTS